MISNNCIFFFNDFFPNLSTELANIFILSNFIINKLKIKEIFNLNDCFLFNIFFKRVKKLVIQEKLTNNTSG